MSRNQVSDIGHTSPYWHNCACLYCIRFIYLFLKRTSLSSLKLPNSTIPYAHPKWPVYLKTYTQQHHLLSCPPYAPHPSGGRSLHTPCLAEVTPYCPALEIPPMSQMTKPATTTTKSKRLSQTFSTTTVWSTIPAEVVACRGYCWKTNKTCGNSEDIHSARVLLSDYLKCTSSTRINVHASLHFHQGKRSLVDCFSLWQTSHNVLLCLDRDWKRNISISHALIIFSC